jgi:hypothetical protein
MADGFSIRPILARPAKAAKVDGIAAASAMKSAKGKTVSKANLPDKICVTCQKAFAWRKKWARDWDNVIYCSDQCRSRGKKP